MVKCLRNKCQVAFVECLRTTVPGTDDEINARDVVIRALQREMTVGHVQADEIEFSGQREMCRRLKYDLGVTHGLHNGRRLRRRNCEML